MFKKNRSSPTTSLNTKELGERLTIGPAGTFSVLHTHHNCVDGCQNESALGSNKRSTRTNVRFDGRVIFSWIFEICLRVCNESDKDCSVSSSWSSCAVVFFGKFLSSSSPLVMYVAVVCVLCSCLLVLSSLFLRHGSQIQSTIHQLETHWLSRHW